MLDYETYKEKMLTIANQYDKRARGGKYIRKWDYHWLEKKFFYDYGDFSNMKTVIDIGTGVGMLPYLLMSKGHQVEATDIAEDISGPMFTQCCDLIGLKRHSLFINDSKPMDFPGKYDMLVATRTEFDRECLTPGDIFNWKFFLDDAFKYVKRVYIKTNFAGSGNHFPDYIRPFVSNPGGPGTGLGKPYRAYYIKVDKDQW
jgi:hypothetical protein|tara:strand:- start:22212 stop:22814 length:603 start_codon:yes stop_codon:yes gene_type:complete